jgi:uncharacterized protein Veg
MNLITVKENVEKNLGKKVIAKVNIGRNRYEIFEGIVETVYPFLFVLKNDNEIKTFSYADILTRNVIIKKI